MTSKIRVAVAQINPELLEVKHNLALHCDYVAQAREQGAELLLFPELSLSGYQVSRNAPAIAMHAHDPVLHALAREAVGITVVAGFVEEGRPGELFNAMAYLRDGKVMHIQRKINLPTYGGLEEGKWFHSGQDLNIVEIKPGWQATCLICADLWNPALTHCAMLQRPEILLAPINSASGVVSEDFSNEQNWVTNVSFYAMMYGTPVLLANRFGREKELSFWGGSCILGPKGEVLAKADDREMLIFAELDRKRIGTARFDMPTVRDANTALIRKFLADY
ncbi:nitrilase-related carbon-nitrogen hydrolase [Marinobacter sp. ELB17]|uniref:nitrilase-related carbon-nitrogen hydrolase n=1 Tax=Marinobacter sp. ELB17 TaxID=270374 RepID=UPI0000F39ABB|nr:nitrilase-related carbon-nitrogen hydrolase [Marinobacter sp. ELB17]EAZ98555.1 carbon-nitrogen hydrolase family protein [Marinobacter sp. ELB17]